MPERLDVHLYATDSPEELLRKLSQALRHAAELRGPVMVHRGDEPYAAVVPPDAALAWARAEESGRLSQIATEAAGLAHPGAPPWGGPAEHR